MAEPTNPELSLGGGTRPKPRVRLRAAIGCVLVVGMACGWLAMGRQKAAKQVEAIRAVEQAGGRVYLDYQWRHGKPVRDAKPPQVAWLRRLVGGQMFDRAVAVDLRAVREPNELVPWLRFMPYVQDLEASGTSLTDTALERIVLLHEITHLRLDDTNVTDQAFNSLARLPKLRFLSLARTQVSDQGVSALARCRGLRNIDLSGTQCTRSAIDKLRRELPKCRVRFVAEPAASPKP